MKNKFFGLKLNAVLLFLLAVLMVVTVKMVLDNKDKYLYPFGLSQGPEKETLSEAQISGNKDDLVSFSIIPGQKVSGVIKVAGSVKNAYFFEANILVNILDADQKLTKAGYGMATTEWMTEGPVSFESTLDFTLLSKGPAFIEIKNDNPSDIRANDKSIFIPIVIE